MRGACHALTAPRERLNRLRLMASFLDFEKPIAELQGRIDELRETAADGTVDIDAEVGRLQAKSDKALRDTYARLTPWQKTQVARHGERPHFKDYTAALFDDFTPLAGDRAFGDDQAIIGGFARFRGDRVMVIGHEKGDDTASRLRHNFGMGKPEGYRKAIRLMRRSVAKPRRLRARPRCACHSACRWSLRWSGKADPVGRSRSPPATRC
jgi:acetyl-CoA carboxylase carboxyl transferase alpha subunit